MKPFKEEKAHRSKGVMLWSSEELANNEQTQIVMDNLLARASTRWTVDQSNIFFCALTKIDHANEEGDVTISKKELKKRLGLTKQKSSNLYTKLKKDAEALMETSKIEFNPVYDKTGKDRSSDFESGMLITYVKADRYNFTLTFNPKMMPLLKSLKAYFTKIDLDSLLSLKRMSSQKLYLYLSSWFDESYPHQKRTIKRNEVPIVFGLTKGQYTRKVKDKHTKEIKEFFDWYTFEKKVLDPTCKEIMDACKELKCDLCLLPEAETAIESFDDDGYPYYETVSDDQEPKYYEKLVDDPFVAGYVFRYYFTDKKTGNLAWVDDPNK